eukprot:281911-Prymnesium_polylepis.1
MVWRNVKAAVDAAAAAEAAQRMKEIDTKEAEQAAIVVQARLRGLKARQDVKVKRTHVAPPGSKFLGIGCAGNGQAGRRGSGQVGRRGSGQP